MRVGIDARMYGAKNTTGIGVYIENLIKLIPRVDSSIKLVVFCLPDSVEKIKKLGQLEVVEVNFMWYGWREQLYFRRIIKKNNIDLMHFPHFNVPLLYNKPYVVTIHDLTPKFFPGPLVKRSLLRKMAYNAVLNHAIKKAEEIITISQHTKDIIKKYFLIADEKITVVYPGVSDYGKVAAGNIEGISKPYLLYLGIWRDHKNLPVLIEAFNQLKKTNNIQLVIAGQEDSRYPEIRSAIKNSSYKKDIITPGFVPDEQLPALYSNAIAFVLPSFAEGFGLVAVEAAFYGTPVVASNSTSLPEVLGQAGLYFEPNNSKELAKMLQMLIDDKSLQEKLSSYGKKRAAMFSWQKCAEEVVRVYKHNI